MFEPSKGGSSLAQSFLQNKATTPVQQLPTITQPSQRPLPQMPQKSSPMGSMAPAAQQSGPLGLGGLGSDPTGIFTQPVRVHNTPGLWTRMQTPDGLQWFPYNPQPAPQQQAYQPSQSQLMARAINERAQKR